MVSIGSSTSFSSALLGIARSSSKVASISNQLSQGKKITSAKDDPKALGGIAQLESAIRGLDAAEKNTSSTQGLLSTAEAGLGQISSNLQSLREIAVQAADGTISAQDRQNLQNQANDILSSMGSTAQSLNFGNVNLLDGSFGSRTVQVGANEGDQVSISLDSATTNALGVNNIDLSTSTGSGNAISAIDSAISSVTSQRGEIGSTQNRLDSIIQSNTATVESLTFAKSAREDLDYGKAVADLTKATIQREASINVLQASLGVQKGNLSLLV